MAKVELKKPIVEEISSNIDGAQSVVLVDYRGLTVEQDTMLRKQLREAGVVYKVYKNTMMNFAFKGTDFEGLAPYLEGPSACAISKDDATAPARVLCKFAKTADKLEIKGGVVDGHVELKVLIVHICRHAVAHKVYAMRHVVERVHRGHRYHMCLVVCKVIIAQQVLLHGVEVRSVL